jgi:hypothetical protein
LQNWEAGAKPGESNLKASNQTIVVAIVALILVGAAFVFGLAVSDNLTTASTPLVTTILGIIATTIVAFIALVKADTASTETQTLKQDVKDGLQAVAVQAAENVQKHEPLDNPNHVNKLQDVIRETIEKTNVSRNSPSPLDNPQYREQLKTIILETLTESGNGDT